MILVSLLATTGVITLARASPMSYATHRRREIPVDGNPELLLLYDRRGLESTDSPPRSIHDIERDYENEISMNADISDVSSDSEISSLARDKKLGLGRNSLSIVNPVDILRQRVLLELARRKAMQDQRQVDANRRILETIGKRSIQHLNNVHPRSFASSENGKNLVYANELLNDARQIDETYTQRIPVDRTHQWYDVDNNVIRENGDDETRKSFQMAANEIRLF